MKISTKIILITLASIIMIMPAKATEVSASGKFKATLGQPLSIYQDGNEGQLGIILPGSIRDLSEVPIDLRAARFTLSGEALSPFNASGSVQTDAGGITISNIVWEYFNINSNMWEIMSTNDDGTFNSSQINLHLDEDGNALIRVYPNMMSSSEETSDETDIFFQITLSCNYTNI